VKYSPSVIVLGALVVSWEDRSLLYAHEWCLLQDGPGKPPAALHGAAQDPVVPPG
jgi:hypothetical protein